MTKTILIQIRQSFGSKRVLFKRFRRRDLDKGVVRGKQVIEKKFRHAFGGDKVLFHKITHDGLARLKRFENQVVPVMVRPERGPLV